MSCKSICSLSVLKVSKSQAARKVRNIILILEIQEILIGFSSLAPLKKIAPQSPPLIRLCGKGYPPPTALEKHPIH
jgi:hypothetical protein